MIYVIQAGVSGPIKIGYTRNEISLKNRLAVIQCGSPEPLSVRYFGEGDIKLEKRAHRALHKEKITGEWFRPTQVTLQFVLIAKEKGIEDALSEVREIKRANDIVSLIESIEITSKLKKTSRTRTTNRGGDANGVFTDESIESLPVKITPYRVHEKGLIPGFSLQVTPNGTKTFVHQYTANGKRRFLRLGTYPYTSIEQARNLSTHARKLIDQGVDPKNNEYLEALLAGQ